MKKKSSPLVAFYTIKLANQPQHRLDHFGHVVHFCSFWDGTKDDRLLDASKNFLTHPKLWGPKKQDVFYMAAIKMGLRLARPYRYRSLSYARLFQCFEM